MERNKNLLLFFILLFGLSSAFLCCAEEKNPVPTLSHISANLPANVNLSIKDTSYKLPREEVLKWLGEETVLSYDPNYFSEIENYRFCQYKKSLACELSFGLKYEAHIKKESQLKLDEEMIGKFISVAAQKTDKKPEDAKLKLEDGKASVFSLGNKGIELDQEKSIAILSDYIKNGRYDNATIELPYKESDPEIPAIGSIDDLGISTLIGEGKSNFRGSTTNRIFNINVATKRFNGVLIKPNEEFSFVKILGEVDGDHGYRPELVIKKDKTEPEFGGGVCQVSTTAYRAALNSGLKITARRNHAYPVQYYNPQGMDATVYVPRPDLRFVNNTPSYILIQTKIVGTELTFSFYGTSDGRKVELNGPKIIERNSDGSMKTTLNQKVTDANGKVIIDDDFNSNYDSPSKYPHPGTTNDVLTQKPNGWSDKEWTKYKKAHGI